MKVFAFGELNTFELFVLLTVIPTVFSYLWYLIGGDILNFESSKLSYTIYTAQDPVNCYQDYERKENTNAY
ncbi:uncharacterized protein LOC115624535 [Scaptodrosophila lebanonensis]|uniref:Uncharacterized protein LOC115624535 n=1 Tax=Drosophila lebanonensis TaxID=7225 RepID=A0A6J2TGJ5_DROLE|nr:uncharacterized protein LOC115624535 [Scaptodrosophila lebanonensis]